MKFSGLQKLTLLDYPGHVACTVFTGGCNFRCPFCHNAGLVEPGSIPQDIDEAQVLNFLRKRQGVLDGVAVTGGEPLLHKDIGSFLAQVKALGFKVKLDTNGANPDLLIELVNSGLVDRVAMDIKNSPALYAATVSLESMDLSGVERSKNFLLQGSVDYEFRTTLVQGLHTRESLIEAASWISGAREYYLQQFKDSGNILDIRGLSAFDEKQMHALAAAVRDIVPSVQVRGV